MKSETRLDSALFQLTPTRTRCDLVVTANGKMEKVASGLVEPFLAHLKSARDQIAKGGYSIVLEPNPGGDVTWFTKGTVERFVRFVSTPEVLERVNTIESEMSQIDKAIAIQSSENLGLGPVEDHQSKSKENIEDCKPVFGADSEKAIVLFKPGVQQHESNGSTTLEENSKVKLLKVLETRKTVLQKEQGMAFARAVAAGFDMDHMAHLISFSENFGASRLMEACTRFMKLWKRKHETGQWLEIEATDAISNQPDVSSMNASGIVISHGELSVDISGKASNESNGMSYQQSSSDHNGDKKPSMDSQMPLGYHQCIQGNFQHAMYPPWPMHSPAGAPVFQSYPMQGMPYYQNYQAGGPFFQPPYPPMGDPKFNGVHGMGQKRHSLESKDGNLESENWEMGVSNGRSQDGTDQSMSEKEVVNGRDSHRKVGQAGKTKSGVVVIRNINYITSNRNNVSGSESESASASESDEEEKGKNYDSPGRKNSMKSSIGRENLTKSSGTWNSNNVGDIGYKQEADSVNWQAFQNCLLRNDEESVDNVDRSMFSPEKEARPKRRQSTAGSDPLLRRRDLGKVAEQWMSKIDVVGNSATQTYKQRASSDELAISYKGLHSSNGRLLRESRLDVQFSKIESGRGGFKKGTRDDFVIYGRGNQPVTNSHSDPLAGCELGYAHNLDKSFLQNAVDESFIIPLRSSSQGQVGSDRRAAIDMGLEVPTTRQRTQDSSNRIRSQVNYEPDDLSLVPERGTERDSTGYDPAVDYEMEVRDEGGKVADNADQEYVSTGVKGGLKKLDKEKKSRVQDALEKRKMEAAMRKGKLSKSNPLVEAQVRAERLRAFKADLQQMKREKEEEEIKRLEALKRERQKRIAARSNSSPAQFPSSSQQIKSLLSTKASKVSKFNDSEPASSSPMQRLSAKFDSAGSNSPHKTTKPGRLNAARVAGNDSAKLSHSASSLPELKKVASCPEPKAITVRARRLSDPKGSTGQHAVLKSVGSDTLLKPKLPAKPEIKKPSAINNLDRTKSATLPELKIKTSRRNSDIIQKKSAAKVIKQNMSENRSSLTSGKTSRRNSDIIQKKSAAKAIKQSKSEIGSSLTSESVKLKQRDEKVPHISSAEENPVIEKTVVVLENEVCAIPFVQISEENVLDRRGAHDVQIAVAGKKYSAIHAPASPTIIGEIDKGPSQFQLDMHPSSNVVMTGNAGYGMLESSRTHVSEKPYQAPFARVSSLEDPCTNNSEYNKAPGISSEMETIAENVKAHISDSTDLTALDLIPGSLEKPRGKESSKGFRRLLKFGRKNHMSFACEHNVESDKSRMGGLVIGDHDATHNYPNEVHTLKNLISQDDSPVGMSHKVTRPFSLLSPFRSKNSEKKLTT